MRLDLLSTPIIMSNGCNQRRPFFVLVSKHEDSSNKFESHTFNINTTENDSMTINDLFIVGHLSQDEVLPIHWSVSAKIILTATTALFMLIGSVFKCIMYRYVSLTNKQNRGWMLRPINVLTITSAITHHITHVWTWFWFLVLLWYTGGGTSSNIVIPFANSMGSHWCQIIKVVNSYGICYLSTGRLGIAIYRILYVKLEKWVKYVIGETFLLWMVLLLSVLVGVILVCMYHLESSSTRLFENTCYGMTIVQTQILIDYRRSTGEQLLTTSYLRQTAICVAIAFNLIEFSIYILFFYIRYTNDNKKSIKQLLTHDVIRERNIRNITTFLGQFYVFITEFIFLLLILLIRLIDDGQLTIFHRSVVFAKFMNFGLISVVEVISSPGVRGFMRRKIQHKT